MSAPVIRGSGIQSGSVGTLTVPFPAGSIIGDLAIVMAGSGYSLGGHNPPSGWFTPISLVSGGTDWQPLCVYKVLTSGDISTGSVTLNFNGSFDVVVAIVTYVGNPGVPRVATAINSPGGQSVAIESNGLGDGNNSALSFAAVRTSGSGGPGRTAATSLGTQLQFSDDGAYAYGVLTNIPVVNGFITQTWTFGAAASNSSCAPLLIIIGPVPPVTAGIATVVEREFGDSLEPWPLQGLYSANVDLILGTSLQIGDIVIAGYTSHLESTPITISDTAGLPWQTLYSNDNVGFFYAVVTQNYPVAPITLTGGVYTGVVLTASSVISFSPLGYSSAGRAVVIRGTNGPVTTAVGTGASSPVAVSLNNIAVSYSFTPTASGPWVSILVTAAASGQTVTTLATALSSESAGHNGSPGGAWVASFPSDDSFLNVFTLGVPLATNLTYFECGSVSPSTPMLVPGFALIASYSTTGDSSLPSSAELFAVPSTSAPNQPINLLWSTLNVAFIRITGSVSISPPVHFDTGFVSTAGSGVYVVANGFAHSITLTLQAYNLAQQALPGVTSSVNIVIT